MSQQLTNVDNRPNARKLYNDEVACCARLLIIVNKQTLNLEKAKLILATCYNALSEFQALLAIELSYFKKPSSYLSCFIEATDSQADNNLAIDVMLDLVVELNLLHKTSQTGEANKLALELKSMGQALGLLQQDPDIYLQNDAR